MKKIRSPRETNIRRAIWNMFVKNKCEIGVRWEQKLYCKAEVIIECGYKLTKNNHNVNIYEVTNIHTNQYAEITNITTLKALLQYLQKTTIIPSENNEKLDRLYKK